MTFQCFLLTVVHEYVKLNNLNINKTNKANVEQLISEIYNRILKIRGNKCSVFNVNGIKMEKSSQFLVSNFRYQKGSPKKPIKNLKVYLPPWLHSNDTL